MLVRHIAAFLALASFAAYGQDILDDSTIGKLVKAGVGEQTIVSMINQQPGKYALSSDDMLALKKAGVSDKILAAMIVRNASVDSSTAQFSGPPSSPSTAVTLPLPDATPIRLRLARNLTSADAKVGDTVDLEALDDFKVDGVLVIARGATAIATVTEAEQKKRMARGGKLGLNIDYVRLVNGDKATLRATKEGKGGGHTGAMTGAMVASAVVFWPAAPLFLLMHGKDVTFPRGTEITAYVDGDIMLDRDRFITGAAPAQPAKTSPPPVVANQAPVRAQPAAPNPPPVLAAQAAPPRAVPAPSVAPRRAPTANPGGLLDITFTSNPPGALVSMYGSAIGRTPFTTRLAPGNYTAVFSANGANQTQSISVGPGLPNIANAAFELK